MRPANVIAPGPGQESVWDYPRPPRLELSDLEITVTLGGRLVLETNRSWRVLETASPPTHYVDSDDFAPGALRVCEGESWCEWKGKATYYDLVAGETVAPRAAWSYLEPSPAFAPIAGYVSLYAGRVDRCTLGGEVVRAQDGDFYGGWITSRVTGPFKGEEGTLGW